MNVSAYRNSFPNLYLFIQDILAEENVVAIRFTMLGTQQGDFMGTAPTGKDIEVDGCCIYRFGDGQIIEQWQEIDLLGLFGQLGVGG